MSYYIINKTIKFDYEKRALLTFNDQNTVILFQPDSNCLKFLIENKGTVISQHDLIEASWGKTRSALITLNTFYQSIMRVRKNLTLIDVGADGVIETIPRQGLIIRSELIEFFESDETTVTSDIFDSLKRNRLSLLTSLHKNKIKLVAISTIVFVMMIGLFLYHENPLFITYNRALRIDKCFVYSETPVSTDIKNKLQLILSDRCTAKSNIYLPGMYSKNWISIFICPDTFPIKQKCSSELHIEPL